MNGNNEEKKLKDAELAEVSGGIDKTNGQKCPRAFSKNCPGGETGSSYKSCEYYHTAFCSEGYLLNTLELPIGDEHLRFY